jgi:hypothetical protein
LFAEAGVVPEPFVDDEEFDAEEEFDEPFDGCELLLRSVQEVSETATVRDKITAGRFLFDIVFPFLCSQDVRGSLTNLKIKPSA